MDQFFGRDRLLDRIRRLLQQRDFQHFRIQVAFAKSGPLLRLAREFDNWRRGGGSIEAVIGINHLGTSRQALEFALSRFDNTYITTTRANSTFHPKFYLFEGQRNATCVIGSHNLTVGGTETNMEGGDLLPCFRTKLSMIFAKGRGREYVEEQAHGSADDWGAETVGSGP